jgi:hypothetical protein
MNENQIIQAALFAIEQRNGITGLWRPTHKHLDGELDLTFRNRRARLNVEIKKELRLMHLPKILELAKKNAPLIVVAETIFPTLKEKLREEEIAYLDTAGNLYVPIKDVFIWIDGHKPFVPEKPTRNRAFTKTGLKMVYYLLQEDDALNLPYRQLAAGAKVALGNVTNIIEGLRTAGFVLQLNPTTLKLQNKPQLLERWITGYRETLRPSLYLGTYRLNERYRDTHWRELPNVTEMGDWGGEPAGEYYTRYLTPETLTYYTDQAKAELQTKWRLLPDREGDLIIYERFWTRDKPHHPGIVPPLLAYTDLLLTDEPRCIETAQMIYNKHLKNAFE